MVVFDLRVEAQQLSLMYVVAPITALLVLASFAPYSVRSRQSLLVPEDVRRLALIFAIVLIVMVWHEVYERKRAAFMVAQCLSGSCSVFAGRASEVRPVHANGESRYSHRVPKGSFKVGDKYFSHSPPDFQSYSPCNLLNDGDLIRVHTMDDVLVLVEKLE